MGIGQGPTPEIKSEIVFIFDLIRDVLAGKVRIPNFQRPFVWKREQMLDLLDSIRCQYPIGSLLIWETNDAFRTVDWVGPVRIPELSQGGMISLVLDGQQRLTTLVGTLGSIESTNPDEADPLRWRVWFNAREDLFEHLKKEEDKQVHHFPMWRLMDTISVLEESRRMLENGGPDGKKYVNKVEELVRIFQRYTLPVTRIKNNELPEAVQIFSRLNSMGRAITTDQMFSALTYREDPSGKPVFNLAKSIDEVLAELADLGFGGVDRTMILRACLATLREDIYRSDWTRVADQKKSRLQGDLSSAVTKTRHGLIRAVEFLHALNIHVDRLLPYGMQLVVLSAFYVSCQQPTEEQKAFLRRWFWVSSFSGWFASSNPSRVAAMVREFRDDIPRNPTPESLNTMNLREMAQPFPKVFDMRSARSRVFLSVLMALRPREKNGREIENPWQRIGEHGPYALGRLLATVADKSLASSPANRMFRIRLDDPSQTKNWLLELDGLDDSMRETILISHGIPASAFQVLFNGDSDEFLKRRLSHLVQLDREFMEREQVVIPPENFDS